MLDVCSSDCYPISVTKATMYGNNSNSNHYPESPSYASTYSLSPSSESSCSFDSTLSNERSPKVDSNCFHSKSNESWNVNHEFGGSTRHRSKSTQNKRGNRESGTHHHHQFHQRHAANLRERKRMQSINDAFEVSVLLQHYQHYHHHPKTWKLFRYITGTSTTYSNVAI